MDAKDVKVGMKVVPHAKTRCTSWDEFEREFPRFHKFFHENGFLVVKTADSADYIHLWDGAMGAGASFNASDFSPAEIEVGDTVRMDCCLTHRGREEKVARINTARGYKPYEIDIDGKACFCNEDELTLIRKAPKSPEQKKEDKPVSKKPRLEDIKQGWVVLVRKGMALVALDGEYGLEFRDAGQIFQGCGQCARPTNYNSDLNAKAGNSNWDIVATKRFASAYHAIRMLSAPGTINWDWHEDMDKPQFKVGDWVEVVKRGVHNYDIGEKVCINKAYFEADTQKFWCNSASGHRQIVYAEHIKPCSPPAPVEITAADIKAKFGSNVRLNLDGQSIEVK